MTNRKQFADWIESGLNQPGVEDDDWLGRDFEPFNKTSWKDKSKRACNIFELALIGKCGSFEQAKQLYQTTENESVPLQLTAVPQIFKPKINLWAYLLEIPYYTVKNLTDWNSEGNPASRLAKMILEGQFVFDE